MKKILFMTAVALSFISCTNTKEYELKKFYKDVNSPAAILMGGTYAGVVSTYNSKADCTHAKQIAEANDLKIGYTNSIFMCAAK